jgi:hypothetical protein
MPLLFGAGLIAGIIAGLFKLVGHDTQVIQWLLIIAVILLGAAGLAWGWGGGSPWWRGRGGRPAA